MSSIDVHVSQAGSIVAGELRTDPTTVAKCTLCNRDVEATAAIGPGAACAPCLRERLDALSVARFRLYEPKSSGTPWGKVTG
ncbi:MAG: hypothetical protein JST00_41435 [Deltaproteobacteria bacterium]|nr:hypothetical protein [Deltaproteobacteria bacterium]